MAKLRDLTGQQFGRLQVISRAPNDGRYVQWYCKCECGNECIVKSSSLTNNLTRSCGCLYKETRPKPINLTGQKFGKLTVLELTEKREERKAVWKCQCDCGNIIQVKGTDLIKGVRVSCGCKGISSGELKIKIILEENNINFIYNKAYFKDLKKENNYDYNLKYDFIIIDNNLPIRLIEYDGEQHFKEISIFNETLIERQKKDKIKNEYALAHNIPLVRIPYWERDNITLEMIMGDQYLIKKEE